MTGKVHDLGFLKRVDRPNGKSQLVDWAGQIVAVVDTAALPADSVRVRRYRYTEGEQP